MTELETLIQQMAKKYIVPECYVSTKMSLRDMEIYKQGFKDADAVGFVKWLHSDERNHGYTPEELYLQYLKTKTK